MLSIIKQIKEWETNPLLSVWKNKEAEPMAKKGGGTVEAVTAVVKPIIEQMGLELWDVRFVKEGAQYYLRIFIDSENGITIDDCERVSRAVDLPLDEADPIQQSYCLEVSSPGVERELRTEEHLRAFLGSPVLVKMIRPIEGVGKEFSGILEDGGKTDVSINVDGRILNIARKDAVYIKLDDFNI